MTAPTLPICEKARRIERAGRRLATQLGGEFRLVPRKVKDFLAREEAPHDATEGE